jgi:uncharacterized membrane protein YdbT with pleckstrin-like domain
MKIGYTLDANEQVVKQYSRHWIDLFPSALAATALIIIAIGMAYGYGRYQAQFAFVPSGAVVLLTTIFLGLAGLIIVTSLWVYRQNHLLLTNLHLIQVEQRGLFGRQTSQLSLARVQDVSGQRSGLWATILNYGDVVVQSAGEQDKFVFRNAPNPQEIADQCLEAHENFVQTNPNREM